MRVVAKLKTPLPPSARTQFLRDLTACAGTEVRLVHTEPALDVFVEAQASDAKSASDLAARLRESPHVESAYVKPDPQLP